MRHLVLLREGEVALQERPVPTIGAGEILLRMEYCGVCGTDLSKVYAKVPGGAVGASTAVRLGHELVGLVEATGEGVAFAPGQRVVVGHHVPDGSSHYSRRGSETMDPHFSATNLDPGGFADFVRVPAEHVRHTVLPMPDSMPPERGVFVEPLACCVRALDRVRLTEGDVAQVVGTGAAGLLFVPLLAARGLTVFAADLRPERLALAARWGAVPAASSAESAAALTAATDGRGADLVILTVLSDALLQQALATVRNGGTILIFGAKPGAVSLECFELWRREINLITSYSATPDGLRRALALLQGHGWPLEETISHRLPLDQAADGFALLHEGRASKVVITHG
jgi:L-iditol 2-dehydrogenase